ncbi:mesaconyl-C(4)-CoA hydratase [Nocardioides sp. AN3]
MNVELVDITEVAATWEPEAVAVEGQLDADRAEVLADLLGTRAPLPGEPIRPLWHEIFLREPLRLSALGADGHPQASGLLPPIRNRRRMFGGSEARIVAPLRIGETARRTVQVADVRLKQGSHGALLIVTEEHRWRVDREDRFIERRSIIYRSDDDGPPAVPPAPVPNHAPGALDERALFLFSSLTSNAHRIHYDAEYARTVEGHRGLLVHGPLTALLGAEAAFHETGRDLAAYTYRLVSPCYAHHSLTYTVTPDGADTLGVVAETDARTCLTATAVLR